VHRKSTVRRMILLLPLLSLLALPGGAVKPKPKAGSQADAALWSAEQLPKLLAKYHEALPGKIRALEFIIYSNRAQMQVQDPAKPENVDQYDYRGEISAPIPVRLHGSKNLEDSLFGLDEVAFDRIPALVAEAMEKMPIEGGQVTHVIVKRGLPFSKDMRICVYVNGTRKDGMLEADGKGHLLKVHAD
jgi:hypothetical protein